MRLIDYQPLCYYFDLNDTKKDSGPQYGVRDYWKGSLRFKTTKFKGIFIRVLEATVFASRLFRPVSYSGLVIPVKNGLRNCASYTLETSGKSTPRFFKASL